MKLLLVMLSIMSQSLFAAVSCKHFGDYAVSIALEAPEFKNADKFLNIDIDPGYSKEMKNVCEQCGSGQFGFFVGGDKCIEKTFQIVKKYKSKVEKYVNNLVPGDKKHKFNIKKVEAFVLDQLGPDDSKIVISNINGAEGKNDKSSEMSKYAQCANELTRVKNADINMLGGEIGENNGQRNRKIGLYANGTNDFIFATEKKVIVISGNDVRRKSLKSFGDSLPATVNGRSSFIKFQKKDNSNICLKYSNNSLSTVSKAKIGKLKSSFLRSTMNAGTSACDEKGTPSNRLVKINEMDKSESDTLESLKPLFLGILKQAQESLCESHDKNEKYLKNPTNPSTNPNHILEMLDSGKCKIITKQERCELEASVRGCFPGLKGLNEPSKECYSNSKENGGSSVTNK